jgi:NAD(P)-dependent dehydrogenase (short-subunit alcohol dehydrogenase family)
VNESEGRVALITGGGTGIGRAIALRLAHDEFDLLLVGRRRAPLEETAESAGQSFEKAIFPIDLTESDAPGLIVDACASRYGRLDVLVNNAGLYALGGPEDTSPDAWRAMMAVNLDTPFLLVKAALPLLKKSSLPSVVNIASTVAYQTVRNTLAYSVSKSGLVHLSRLLALELAPHKIRVNCICPGVVESPIFDTVMSEQQKKERLEQMTKAHPLGRVGQPEDVAGMVAYLVSDDASWVTGGAFACDGGISLT